ncbi:MAG: hypothetical protein KAX37_02930 [Opitutaceae bacterium]|nr:hypothetical protein [Opitutaceae bacterium]
MSELPYLDTKPVGAAGFYSGINSTFRYFIRRFDEKGWRRYLEELGQSCFAPVNGRWRQREVTALPPQEMGQIAEATS